jgi:hypothetical protein
MLGVATKHFMLSVIMVTVMLSVVPALNFNVQCAYARCGAL